MGKKIIFIAVVMILNQMAFSQEKVFNVWKGKIPGAIENRNYVPLVDSSDNWSRMWNVTNPLLDYYPAKPESGKTTAVVICPGGGYARLAIGHEGRQIAQWFNSFGVSAFVLKYRLPSDSIMKDKTVGPLQDVQEAIRLVRRQADALNIDPNKIGVMGFSAGGHLASTASTHFNEKVYDVADTTSARPDFSILIYPVISMQDGVTHRGSRENLLGKTPSQDLVDHFSNELQVTDQTPPAFMVHSMDDGTVPVLNSINYALAMRSHKIPCELHIYEHGGHGYGMGRTNGTESIWPQACEKWMKVHGF